LIVCGPLPRLKVMTSDAVVELAVRSS